MICFAIEDSEIGYLASGLLVVSAWSTVLVRRELAMKNRAAFGSRWNRSGFAVGT